MPWVRGSELPERLRVAVLNRYVYRMTVESIRRWPEAAKTMRDGGYAMPPISDEQWLSEKAFYVTRNGELSERHRYCTPARLVDLHEAGTGHRGMNNAAL